MDLVLRGAAVIDGSGRPARPADVRLRGQLIESVDEPSPIPPRVASIDLDGLVLAPGFIDIHTHYDAQVLWDPDLTPSSWHGVTTVVMGNCGFGIAPTRPQHRDIIVRTLENVEGMSAEALEAGISWSFETFPDYLEVLAASKLRLNVGVLLGHTPLRLYVLGEEAAERSSTDAEVGEICRLVAQAMDAGAIGFATSRGPLHVGANGKPVPSRLAAFEELLEIVDVLKAAGHGIVQAAIGPGLYVRELATLANRLGRPVTWTALLAGDRRFPALQTLERQAELGGELWPQVACRPIVTQITLADPLPFSAVPAFADVLAVPHAQRAALYADPGWRDRARREMRTGWDHFWPRVTVQESECHPDLRNGATLASLAAEQSVDPIDLMVDLSLAEGLRTRFRIVLANDDEGEIAALLNDSRTLLGLSDAGAHASQLCDAGFSTFLLEHWVRKTGILSLEKAVWRLTGQPASVLGLGNRGLIAPGYVADLVAFDPGTVALVDLERVWDLPSGADRLVARSRGIVDVWVNGEAIRLDGKDVAGARPGHLIRSENGGGR